MDENTENLVKTLKSGVAVFVYSSVEDGSDVFVPDTDRARKNMRKAAALIEEMDKTISFLEQENKRLSDEIAKSSAK